MTIVNDNTSTPTSLPAASTVPASAAPRTWTSAAEDAVSIRAALKAKGWNARKISVRSESYSMGSSITVTILAAGIPRATVKEIAERFSRVRYCEVTGEILSGGNRYVRVTFDQDLIQAAGAEFRPWLEAMEITDNSLASITVAGREYHVGRRSKWEYRCFGPEGHENAHGDSDVAYTLAVAKLEAGSV